MAEVAAFHRVLAANRGRLNARFAAARQGAPTLEAGVTLALLDSLIGPVAGAVAAVRPDAVADVVDELFDLLLQLIAGGVVGPDARRPVVAEAWRTLLPVLPDAVAASPRRVAAALTNALHNLATEPSARPDAWLTTIRRTGPFCPDVRVLLEAGQVAAWLAGLAHYRTAALAICRNLDPGVLRGLLSLGGDVPASAFPAVLDRMSADPWLTFEVAASPPPARRLALVRRAGAFRGFGGDFLAPPTVGWSAGDFYVQDGDAWWLLTADAYGATFHRAAPPSATVITTPGSPFSISGGEASCGSDRAVFPELAAVKSWAADGATLAVTSLLSHHVYLFARVAGAAIP